MKISVTYTQTMFWGCLCCLFLPMKSFCDTKKDNRKTEKYITGIHAVNIFPEMSDRAIWEKSWKRESVGDFRKKILAKAEGLSGRDIPVLPASKFMDFQRTGDRRTWERNYYFARRRNLTTLVLAETFEYKKRFMDDIINHIWAILNEPTWCSTAHARLSPQDPLPDFRMELIDLFSAETSAALASVLMLAEKELIQISPNLVKRMKRTIIERAIVPVEKNMENFTWRTGRNNWTPWICSNLILAANTVLADDTKRLEAFVNKLQPCMERYYSKYSEDGACEEGASYWMVSVGCSMLYYQYLFAMTDGRFSIFQEKKYHRMCEFISDNWFGEKNITTFADCQPVLNTLPGWVWKTAALLKNEKFENFVRSFPMELPENSTDFGSILASLLWAEEKAPVPRQDFSSYYKDMQLLFIRSGRLHAAMIGNRNSGGHHHLDIGGFIIAVDGREAILDLGSVTYTKDTFSEKRFNNPVLNSLYHNVPVFDGKSQGNGAEFAAKNVVYKQNGTKHTFSLDLKSAYPAETGLQKCIRTFVLDTETKTVSVTDEWEAGKSLQYSMTLFLPVPPEKSPLEIKSSLIARTEKFNVTDLSQKSYWGDTLWKSEYRASKATSGNHTFVFCLR